MYIRRMLAAAGASAAIAAGILAGAPMTSVSPATASNSPTLMAAAQPSINCFDGRIYNTVGRITCTGTGLFRAIGTCERQFDQTSREWVRVNNSTATAYVECRHRIRGVRAETRPGA